MIDELRRCQKCLDELRSELLPLVDGCRFADILDRFNTVEAFLAKLAEPPEETLNNGESTITWDGFQTFLGSDIATHHPGCACGSCNSTQA